MSYKSLFVVLALIVLPLSASAHERNLFQIGDKQYLFTVGSLNEPLYVDDKSGVDLRVVESDVKDPVNSKASNAKPVAGLETALQVELIAGEVKKIFPFTAVYNDTGAYKAPFYPTKPIVLTYRVFGTLNNLPIDLSFSCNPAGHARPSDDLNLIKIDDKVSRLQKIGAFGCPQDKTSVGFPDDGTALASVADTKDTKTFAVAIVALLVSAGAISRRS